MHQVLPDLSSKANLSPLRRLSISTGCLYLLLACPVGNLLQAQSAKVDGVTLPSARPKPDSS